MIFTLSGSAIYVSNTRFAKIGFSTKALFLDVISNSICELDPICFFVIDILLFSVAVPSVYTVSKRKAYELSYSIDVLNDDEYIKDFEPESILIGMKTFLLGALFTFSIESEKRILNKI